MQLLQHDGDGAFEAGVIASRSVDDHLIASLEQQTRSIEAIFAEAGRGLGEGLDIFEGLKERLTSLSHQLASDDLAVANATFLRLAGDLQPLRTALKAETAVLLEIDDHSRAAGKALELLGQHIRFITFLARSARVESISINDAGAKFSAFVNEIVELATRAKTTIETCASEHGRMEKLLAAALAAQREFEALYGPALEGLCAKLQATLAEVRDRQQRGMELTREAVAKSGKLSMDVGMAIVSLQSGDSIRQRLEHATAGLRLEGELGSLGDAGLPIAATEAARAVLQELQAAQLAAAAQALGDDTQTIDESLLALRSEAEGLIDLVRALHGAGGSRAGSFIADLGDDLAQASALFGRCNSARGEVDRVAQALAAMLDICQQTIGSLAGTVGDIVLIGLNAGLRAARVGSDGRSLAVIAQELKAAADLVARDAHALPSTFARMQTVALELKRDDRLDAAHLDSLDRALGTGLAAMQAAATSLDTELDRLVRESTVFGSVVDGTRLRFSSIDISRHAVIAAGEDLTLAATSAEAVTPDDDAIARDWVTERTWRQYTMAAEREIHERIVGKRANMPARTY